jgi:uncharacterized protein with HEPN domain
LRSGLTTIFSKYFEVQPTIADRLEHIAAAINNLQRITSDQTQESFAGNLVVRLAVERLLEVVSEASRHIPAEAKSSEPGIHWRRLADLGNRLRHAYHETDAGLLWAMIENDLEPLRRFVERLSNELDH